MMPQDDRFATSTTPATIAMGHVRLVLNRAIGWEKGTPVYVAADDVRQEGPGSNAMVGAITVDASRLLDIEVTRTKGHGCFKAWTVTRVRRPEEYPPLDLEAGS